MKSMAVKEKKSENRRTGIWSRYQLLLLDPEHSSIQFTISQLFGHLSGHFQISKGTLTLADDDLEGSTIRFLVDADSLNSGNSKRDQYLRSENFLDTENHPFMEFEGWPLEKKGSFDYLLGGELTIKDISCDIGFEWEKLSLSWRDNEKHKIDFSAKARINRLAFGFKNDPLVDTAGIVQDEWITTTLNLAFLFSNY